MGSEMRYRDWFGWTSFTLLWSLWLIGCCQKSPGLKIPFVVVDVHSHMFNAHDLPLAGILAARGAPDGVAVTAAKIINWWTPDDELPLVRVRVGNKAPSDDLPAVANSIRKNVELRGPRSREASLFPSISQKEKDELLNWAGMSAPKAPLSPEKNDEFEVEVIARILARAQFPPSDSTEQKGVVGTILGFVRFLGVVTHSHTEIAEEFSLQEYPQVKLFVHHMMDLATVYADAPQVSFDKQIHAMTLLDARQAGKSLHFVAFDPFRRTKALDLVKQGLTEGAVGVKFYPPSGYRATQNEIPPPPQNEGDLRRWKSRYGGAEPLDGKKLDANIDELFAYCEKNDIPIFTHCTATGFQAEDGYGVMSDPKFWAIALEKHRNLRICFGHSGGEDYWFSSAEGPNRVASHEQFGLEVVRLCLKYPHVYCETGYMEMISDPSAAKNLLNRLLDVIEQQSDDGTWKFGDKIMYGSDWFMISRESHPERYLSHFWNIFLNPRLQPWARSFFGRNAARFLKLGEIAERAGGPFTEDQRNYWREIVKSVGAK